MSTSKGPPRLGLIVRICASVLAAVGVAEIAIRVIDPIYPIIAVDEDRFHVHFRTAGGTPVWEANFRDQRNLECARNFPDRTRILFFGDSITFGFTPNTQDVVKAYPAVLQDRLNAALTNSPTGARADSHAVCVMNFAQNSFGFAQNWAVAQEEIPREKPALVFWQIWDEKRAFVMLGDTAYDLGSYVKDSDGFPSPWLVPRQLNHWLFLHSRLYRQMVLQWGPRIDHEVPTMEDLRDRYERVEQLTRSVGAKLVIVFGTTLSEPFRYVAPQTSPNYKPLMPWGRDIYTLDAIRSLSLPVYFMADQLVDEDYQSLRLDPCCHFNAKGHEVLGERFVRIVRHELASPVNAPPVVSAIRE